MTIPLLFIHLSFERHLGCFRFRATMDNAAMNVHIQEFLWTSIFSSLGRIPRSGIAGSADNSLSHHLRVCWILYQSASTILLLEWLYHSQQCK